MFLFIDDLKFALYDKKYNEFSNCISELLQALFMEKYSIDPCESFYGRRRRMRIIIEANKILKRSNFIKRKMILSAVKKELNEMYLCTPGNISSDNGMTCVLIIHNIGSCPWSLEELLEGDYPEYYMYYNKEDPLLSKLKGGEPSWKTMTILTY